MASDRGNDRARDSAGDRAADKVGATLGRATHREQQAEQQAEQAAEQKTEQAIEAHHASGNFSHSTTSPTAMAGGGICSAAARTSESTQRGARDPPVGRADPALEHLPAPSS